MSLKRIYIITGEASGDILGARLMVTLKDVRFNGIGGEAMTTAGLKSLFPMSELSVMGFWEVVPRLFAILRRVREVVDDIERVRPDVIVTVDSWGFVSQVLRRLRCKKIETPVIHYVAPQVWAWKKGRAKSVAKLVDCLMTLWPYEPPLFEKYGLKSIFVGHPVVEHTSCDFHGNVNARTNSSATYLCILPGSRHSEVSRLAPMFQRVVERLQGDFPNLKVVVPTVEAVRKEVEKALPDAEYIIGQQERYAAFRASKFAIAASGTVSLELAACGVPHIIAYRFSPLTNILVKMVVKTKFANMINILANREIIPEFVLGNCREELIYEAALEFLRNKNICTLQVKEAAEQLKKMKPEGMMPSEKAAEIVCSYLN